ncbi:uncharacterized protein EDB93DRAFT_382499 [Suillus bovinus]|uniref:uncharacterized protein n=1 Tax=Suillus bovinus TaxID=48563 RepID=UPI001B87A2CA|nr:uncharacterized protein EDB93DRAFT_382499 [Suillus bovinus]KAG2148216.1 hypothetical protein EDB93DRAFT_382499 [Suillus bovinus]
MESLLKILLILSPPIAMHVTFTPPPIPTGDHDAHNKFIEWILLQDADYGLPITKAISWTIAFTELAITTSHAMDTNIFIFPNGLQAVIGSLRAIQDVPVTSPFLFGTSLIVIGTFIRWRCFRNRGQFFTFELSVRKGHQVITNRPYGVVRHLSHARAVLLSIGQFILHGSLSSLVRRSRISNVPALKAIAVVALMGRMIVIVCLIIKIRHEDQMVRSISRSGRSGPRQPSATSFGT